MLSPASLTTRAALCSAFDGVRVEDAALREVLWHLEKPMDRAAQLRVGFVVLGRVAVRCDRLEELLTALSRIPAAEVEARRVRASELLACPPDQADQVLQALPKSRRRRRRRGSSAATRDERGPHDAR